MKKSFIVLIMCLGVAFTAPAENEIVFTTVLENPITSVKNQNRSGTCWDYATTGFVEAELLRMTGKVYNLSEMFVASKDYVDCAEYHVRMHGNSRFSEGGSADDVFEVIDRHGICPEEAMARPGSMIGDTLANFTEFFATLEPYVQSIAKGSSTKLTSQWKVGLQGILDAYLGKCPETFTYEGKQYTPKSFARALGIDKKNYVSITSFTHHPFYEQFVIEAPYKWRPRPSWNVTLDEMMAIIDNALSNGYTVCWGGDVSEDGFTRTGLGIAADIEHAPDLTGSDAARWLKLTKQEKAETLKRLGAQTPELAPTQELRQERFDNWQSTYDHVMLIFGFAKDQNGREYYMVKNSWGDTGDYHGIWYMSKAYIALNTTYIFLNKAAVKKDVRKKLGF
ncbi:MAG: aminopeptidase [Muribaculaceae bacterium]|nr:aminopeptidase [Muribaculaceae bacterium]